MKLSVPEGLEKTVILALRDVKGRELSLGRQRLVSRVRGAFPGVHERIVRQAVHNLRQKGWLICSAPGRQGGYFMAGTKDEFDEFIQRELHPKAMDLLKTEKAMRNAARSQFGEAAQPGIL